MRDTFAAIDVGSNAARLKIARRRANGALETLHQERDPVGTGEGVFRTGELPAPTLDQLVLILRRYAEAAGAHGAGLRAVATSAIREARNRAEVLERARLEAGVDLEVISGREEARLACLGVLDGTSPGVTSLCIDIGGGSSEVALALGEQPSLLVSVPIGSVRLAQKVDAPGVYRRAELESLRDHAAQAAERVPTGLGGRTGGLAIACSGTIRALIEFATAETRPFAHLGELVAAVDELAAMSPAGRRRFFEPRRADNIVAGGVILEALSRRLGVERVRAVKRGVRDGILVELARGAVPVPAELRAARLEPAA